MDELIQSLDQLTTEIMSKLQVASYEELVEFVEKRQKFVDAIADIVASSNTSVEQKQSIHRILANDTVILERMSALWQEAQNFLHKRGQAKMQRNAYDIHYAPDSILMDRRK